MTVEYGIARGLAADIAAARQVMRISTAASVPVGQRPGLFLMNNAEAEKAVKDGAVKLAPVPGTELFWLVQK